MAGRARAARVTARGCIAVERAASGWPVAGLALLLAGCAGAQRPPPPPARAPARAAAAETEPRRYVSARAQQHVLTALLARERDDHAAAARELREALL